MVTHFITKSVIALFVKNLYMLRKADFAPLVVRLWIGAIVMIKAFTLGLIMGAVIGTAFGVLIMACVQAGRDYYPSEVNENAPNSGENNLGG